MQQATRQKIIEEASEWLMRMQEQELSPQEQQQLQEWQQQSPMHQKVWQNALKLQTKFSDVPLDLLHPVLDKLDSANDQQSHKKYIWLLAILPALSALYYANDQQQWLADHRSAVGERKTFTLPDGGKIILNGRSAIDVDYSDKQRTVVLRKGEIWIETQPDSLKRPFIVETKQGTAQALGTQYLVRMQPKQTFVAVHQGAVKIRTQANQQEAILNLNQQAYFDQHHIDTVHPMDVNQYSWTKGFLMVNEMPLKDFIQRLQPYQKGKIQLDRHIQDIKISGTYPVDDLQQIYTMLAQTYHLDIDIYAGGYWVRILPKKN